MNIEEIAADAPCVFLDEAGNHDGQILGATRSTDVFVWAAIHDLRAVFQFHPSNAAVDRGGNIVFRVYDRRMSLQAVANRPEGDLQAPMFYYAKNADHLLRKVRMLALLLLP